MPSVQYDFDRHSINSNKGGTSKPEVIKAHFLHSAERMKWFAEEGLDLLASPKCDDFREWGVVADWAIGLLQDFPATLTVRAIFRMAVERGVKAVVKLAVTTSEPSLVEEEWLKCLMYNLQPGARCGLNANPEICQPYETRALLDKLVAVAQRRKSEYLLEQIAHSRYPNSCDDGLARWLFIAHHKNW